MRVTHVITALGTGGAEAALFRLVAASPARELQHTVISMIDQGAFGARLLEHGIPVTCLGMRRGVPDPLAVMRLVRALKRERPDVVSSWMYHANLLAGAAAALARVPVVWNIHHADVDPRHGKRLTHLTNSVCARLSGILPSRIVCCAESAMRSHRALGYRADRMVVIPNGFELDRFVRAPREGEQVRRELSIASDAQVVGHVARFHPDKDHGTLLAAARRVVARRPGVVFVLVGDGVEWSNHALAASIDALGLRGQLRLLGVRRDVPALLSAMDVLALSSRSEAFPQVLGEAMSCELPCVATDCGDARDILGESGRIVPPGDPDALGQAVLDLLALAPHERAALGSAARERVRQRYELGATLRRHAALYLEVASGRRGRPA